MNWIRQFGTPGVDQGHAVGYGEFGVYVAGDTVGTFPGETSAGTGGKDAFLSLHDESGKLKWNRQFGSVNNSEDVATGVAGDGSGAYVVGYTAGVLPSQSQADGFDSFIRKYDPDGVELWTRQFGAMTNDFAYAVAAHTSGVYVVGHVECCGGAIPGQPVTSDADAYVKKLSGDGKELWTRMIGTSENERALGVAVDPSGVYIAGTTNGDLDRPPGQRDGYVRKYSHDGELLWTRQFGMRNDDGLDTNEDVFAIAAGPAGVFVTGATAQGAAPGETFAGGLWDAFLLRFNADGELQWHRQIGSNGDDYAYGIAVGAGHVLVAGGTGSDLAAGSFVGGEDAFLRLFDFDGNVLGTHQFGDGFNDSGRGVVAFPGGFFVAGTKLGSALDLEPNGDSDSFVMQLIPPPFVPEGGVRNAASLAESPAPLAPGSRAVVFGAYLNKGGGVQELSSVIGPDGKVTTSLAGTEITVGSVPVPILISTASEVSIQIPFEVAGQDTALLVVTVAGQSSIPRTINIAPTGPGIFTQNKQGTGLAAVMHEDGVTLITPGNPAKRDELVVLFLTGLGVLNPPLETGMPAGANGAAAASAPQISLLFGAANATTIEYAGASPGFVGLDQIKVRIPAGAPTTSDVPVSLSVSGRQANPVVIPIGQ